MASWPTRCSFILLDVGRFLLKNSGNIEKNNMKKLKRVNKIFKKWRSKTGYNTIHIKTFFLTRVMFCCVLFVFVEKLYINILIF